MQPTGSVTTGLLQAPLRHGSDATQRNGTGSSAAGSAREVEIESRARTTLKYKGTGADRYAMRNTDDRIEGTTRRFVKCNGDGAHTWGKGTLPCVPPLAFSTRTGRGGRVRVPRQEERG